MTPRNDGDTWGVYMVRGILNDTTTPNMSSGHIPSSSGIGFPVYDHRTYCVGVWGSDFSASWHQCTNAAKFQALKETSTMKP